MQSLLFQVKSLRHWKYNGLFSRPGREEHHLRNSTALNILPRVLGPQPLLVVFAAAATAAAAAAVTSRGEPLQPGA